MRRLGLASMLAGLAGVFAGPRPPVHSTNDVIRFGFRQRHPKRAMTAAEAKRQARKLRNVRARAAK